MRSLGRYNARYTKKKCLSVTHPSRSLDCQGHPIPSESTSLPIARDGVVLPSCIVASSKDTATEELGPALGLRKKDYLSPVMAFSTTLSARSAVLEESGRLNIVMRDTN